jgi:hypothetical protein
MIGFGLEAIFAIMIALVGIALPLVVLVVLFMIYSKLNNIERLLSRRESDNR